MSKQGYKAVKLLRIAVAGAILLLFYISISISQPLYNSILKNLTRLQFFPSLINVVFSGGSWLAAGFLPVTFFTLLVGRLYCSVLCPLGIVQDILIFSSGKKRHRKYRTSPSAARLHAAIASISLVGLLIGLPLLFGLLEPYAFWGRIYRDLVLPLAAGVSIGVVEVLRTVNIFWAPVQFRGEIAAVMMTLIAAVLFVWLTCRYGRWYCNRLCPTGAVLRLLSLRPIVRMEFDKELCTKCGVCAHVCPAGCIDVSAQRVEYNRCIVCFECTVHCPFDALSFTAFSHRKQRQPAPFAGDPDLGRRKALMLAVGSLGAAAVGGFGFSLRPLSAASPDSSVQDTPGLAVLPPGSQSKRRYTRRCVSCHTCVSVCPTHVLQPSFFALGVSGFLQPIMDYKTAYCEWECSRCTQICPTGALKPLSIPQKKLVQMGTVEFDQDRCVVFTDGTDCGACAEVCPTQAVRMVPYKNGLTQPHTETDICSGCGSCEYACPVDLPKAIFVVAHSRHQTRDERVPQQTSPTEDVPEEFPF